MKSSHRTHGGGGYSKQVTVLLIRNPVIEKQHDASICQLGLY